MIVSFQIIQKNLKRAFYELLGTTLCFVYYIGTMLPLCYLYFVCYIETKLILFLSSLKLFFNIVTLELCWFFMLSLKQPVCVTFELCSFYVILETCFVCYIGTMLVCVILETCFFSFVGNMQFLVLVWKHLFCVLLWK